MATLFKQPVSNIRECLNEAEKLVTQNMRGDESEDFSRRLHTLALKRDNIMQELRIMVRQAVNSHQEELAHSYETGDADCFETVASGAFMEIEGLYQSKVTELLVFAEDNFKSCKLYLDTEPNLTDEAVSRLAGRRQEGSYDLGDDREEESASQSGFWNSIKGLFKSKGEQSLPEHDNSGEEPASQDNLWDSIMEFFKSREKREEERFERMKREAELQNERMQYKVQELIRKKQEARQLADSDLDGLYRAFNTSVTKGMDEKYQDLLMQIQEKDSQNKQKLEAGKRQMGRLKALRGRLMVIENTLG